MSPFFYFILALIPLLFLGSAVAAIFSAKVRAEIREQKGKYAGLAALALLSLFTMHYFHQPSSEDRQVRTLQLVNRIRAAILNYENEYSAAPTSTDNAPLMRELRRGNPKKKVFLILNRGERDHEGEAIDAWGTPLRIVLDDPSDPQIQSAGPDKKWDTRDDINSKTSPSSAAPSAPSAPVQ